MTIRVAITGYGRIGRNVLRAFYEENKWSFKRCPIGSITCWG